MHCSQFAKIWATATPEQKDAFKAVCIPRIVEWIRADIRQQAFDSKHAMQQVKDTCGEKWSEGVRRAHDRAAAAFDADIEALVAAVE